MIQKLLNSKQFSIKKRPAAAKTGLQNLFGAE